LEGDEIVTLPFRDVGALLAEVEGEGSTQDLLPPGKRLSVRDVELAPAVSSPSKIVCVGVNYVSHLQEGRAPDSELPKPKEFPTLFAKFAQSLCGPADGISLPVASTKVDWEAELVVVVGKRVSNASHADASAAIAGYAVGNDISMRDWQFRTSQFLQGKTWDGCTPLGPIVTADEIGEDGRPDLRMVCEVNGEIMQDARTSEMLWTPGDCVAYISTFTELLPGDLIFTGTCAGVGGARTPPRYLVDGDTLVTRIEGLGETVNRFTVSAPRTSEIGAAAP
jgi:acylpyruvate hydrolase